ncbi:hypothetical protein E4U21_005404 [Claviceps maximensis]|nr:hypothetical protein E4U21_005404 [Claviceps maximensis]
MDPKFAGLFKEEVPPIPARHRLDVTQRDPRHHHARDTRDTRDTRHRSTQVANCASIPPASPEIISSLITSLSVISQPAQSHFESQPAAALPFAPPSPTSPFPGSFGVDYGAYARPELQDSTLAPTSLDDLAASPPVIRTSKPTSGFSPLAAAKSPKSRSSSRDSVGSGFRNLIRSSSSITSRPSSPGSVTSKNNDTHNSGNVSIERPTAESKAEPIICRSHDSWSKKTGWSSKSIMYMSSKEQLRERESERKRLSGQAGSSTGEAVLASYGGIDHGGGKLEPIFAETVISEEPASHGDTLGVVGKDSCGSPQPVPTRDSSLRKPRIRQRQSSDRCSKRDGKVAVDDAILEWEEQVRGEHNVPATARSQHTRTGSDTVAQETSFLLEPDEFPTPSTLASSVTHSLALDTMNIDSVVHSDEGAAPSPAVSQRRRDDNCDDRKSGRMLGRSTGPRQALGLKRSNSRLKQLQRQPSPKSESRASMNNLPESSSQSQNVYPAGYERPASADSIDDAVESYLCAPRLSQKIQHPHTGRIISFSEVGDATGSAIFCCVGMGLTRYITGFYDELALTLKLRLITPDRPGVGGSEPYADDTTSPLSWPDDVYAICQALKITKFSILAHSAGAIYALATALRMPQHIRGRIHLLAPWIPPSQMNVFGGSQTLPPTNAIPTSQKILRHLPTTFLKAANSSFMTATSSSITSSLPKNARRTKRKTNTHGKEGTNSGARNVTLMHSNDPNGNNKNTPDEGHQSDADLRSPNMSEEMDRVQPGGEGGISGQSATRSSSEAMIDRERQMMYDTRLTHAIWELATTGANPAVDLLVCLERRHTIGFRYVDITRPVVIHHGSRDTRVPVENVKWLGKAMRRCEVRVLEGEGHGLMASATVMGSLLMEMSKEWEDWMRLTGADKGKDRERGRRGTITSAA